MKTYVFVPYDPSAGDVAVRRYADRRRAFRAFLTWNGASMKGSLHEVMEGDRLGRAEIIASIADGEVSFEGRLVGYVAKTSFRKFMQEVR